jgi:ATP-binding cassette subfamily B protein
VLVDGCPLDGPALTRLRCETAWVDPAVQLWNRSLLDNLRYGLPTEADRSLPSVIEQADLLEVLDQLPDGLQTALGEGGRLVAGGEGERVRLARAMLRPCSRLVILDEPFRGLDHRRRRELLARARRWWGTASLLCITHDIADTLSFDRIWVMDQGRIIEDGPPVALASRTDSAYRALLDAEARAHDQVWSAADWRRLYLANGELIESAAEANLEWTKAWIESRGR